VSLGVARTYDTGLATGKRRSGEGKDSSRTDPLGLLLRGLIEFFFPEVNAATNFSQGPSFVGRIRRVRPKGG